MKTYNVDEVAEVCKCHPSTIREYIRSGQLLASKPGRSYCIKQSALDAFLRELENEQVQMSLENRSEKLCQKQQTVYIDETVSGTLILCRQAARELDVLLAPKAEKRRKN